MKKRFATLPVDLGHGFTVEFSSRPDGIWCEWSPDVPPHDTRLAVLERYRKARTIFFAAQQNRVLGPFRAFDLIVTTVLQDTQ